MIQEYTVSCTYCGSAGQAIGFQQSSGEYKGSYGKYKILVGLDCDPYACQNFENLTGAPAVKMDLFSRKDYILFHGKEPPEGWREVTPSDILAAHGGKSPDVVFMSPPCKGLSGLLPSEAAESEKYQALNRLTVRGLELNLEAFENDPVGIYLFENVPRITTRGAALLKKIRKLFISYGYVIPPENEMIYDCGELGNLGQRRKRFLMIARHPDKVGAFVYKPPKMPLRTIGDVIGKLPMPDDPSMGPMHRLPRLQWKTWVRLALIPAGGDWRDLQKIAPEEYRLEYIPRGGGPYGVQQWDNPSNTVIGNASIKGSNGVAVADPRIEHAPRQGSFKIQDWDEPSTTVIGSGAVGKSNGAACVADVRLKERDSRHPGVYRITKWDEPGPCVTGTRFGSGAPAIPDPRIDLGKGTHNAIYRMTPWDEPTGTVTGAHGPNNGAICIPDVRFNCSARSGTMKVQSWDEPGNTVTASGDIHAGSSAIADYRIPGDKDNGTWIIIAQDGTWHRPLTTLELAALQGFPLTMSDGSPLLLAGKSDARWREAIGNAVPPPAAKAMGDQIIMALMASEHGEWMLGSTDIWVKDANDHLLPIAFIH